MWAPSYGAKTCNLVKKPNSPFFPPPHSQGVVGNTCSLYSFSFYCQGLERNSARRVLLFFFHFSYLIWVNSKKFIITKYFLIVLMHFWVLDVVTTQKTYSSATHIIHTSASKARSNLHSFINNVCIFLFFLWSIYVQMPCKSLVWS